MRGGIPLADVEPGRSSGSGRRRPTSPLLHRPGQHAGGLCPARESLALRSLAGEAELMTITGMMPVMPPARVYDPSPAALRPLMETFWSPQGWRSDRAWPDPEVMRQAVAAGVMFARPRLLDHDGWVKAARDAASGLTAAEVGEAFLASLTSRRLDLRSALGSYAVARFLPEHDIIIAPHDYRCALCGQDGPGMSGPVDMNVLSFERFKWGGVRRDNLTYVAFDLEQFAVAPRLAPTPADIAAGQELIGALRRLPAGTAAARAVTHRRRAAHVPATADLTRRPGGR